MKKVILVLLFFSNLFAHPHIFIDIHSNISTTKDKSTVKFVWKIDEMNSSVLIMESDTNLDNIIDESENKYIYENFFLTLEEFNFYTDIKVNGKSQKFPKVKNFKAYIENHRLCYSFELPKKYDIKNTTFDFGDNDFFVSFMIRNNFIKSPNIKTTITEVDNDFFLGYKLEFK